MQTVKLDKVLTAARRGAALFTAALLLSAGIPGAEAKQKPRSSKSFQPSPGSH